MKQQFEVMVRNREFLAALEGLQHSMSDQEFDAALGRAVAEIYQASTEKV